MFDIHDPAHPVRLTGLLAQLGKFTALEFSPTANVLATGGTDGIITFWDVADPTKPQRLAATSGTAATVSALRFSADGRMLVSTDLSGAVRLWNTSSITNPALIGQFDVPLPPGRSSSCPSRSTPDHPAPQAAGRS